MTYKFLLVAGLYILSTFYTRANPDFKTDSLFNSLPSVQASFIWSNGNWQQDGKRVYQYTNTGQIAFLEGGMIDSKGYSPTVRWMYKYDSNEKLIEYIEDYINNGEEIPSLLMKYNYSTINGNKNSASFVRYTSSEIIKTTVDYGYDSNENLVIAERRDSTGLLLERIIYTYNIQNQLTKKSVYNFNNHVLLSINDNKYKYNEKGNLIEDQAISYKEEGGEPNFSNLIEYAYNDKGHLISKIYKLYFLLSKSYEPQRQERYLYNEAGNILEKSDHSWGDNKWREQFDKKIAYKYDSNNKSVEEITSELIFNEGEKNIKKEVTYYGVFSSIGDNNPFSQNLSLTVSPNPSNESLAISYSLQSEGAVKITLYNMMGHEIAVLQNNFEASGSYKIPFKADNLPSGVYLLKMAVGKEIITTSVNIAK